MTNKDMVPKPGPGPAPRDRNPPQGPKKVDDGRRTPDMDPPDSPQVKPSQDRK
ncbi:MAG: hypothetical protein M3158_12890 [Pseudomonadota bacterium]|jgi:hypothetical protein|nr:hypothetical protein [Pseudomonadota bacterium]